MRIEVRHGRPRVSITHIEQAVVIFKPSPLEFWKCEERRLAIHRWGQGWVWEDNNRPCPAYVEQELNKEVH